MSNLINDFQAIRSIATKKCLDALTNVEDVQHELINELDNLWDAVEYFFCQGELTQIDQVLTVWSNSLPKNDETASDHSLLKISRNIFRALSESISSHPDPVAAAGLYQGIYPVFLHINEQVALIEINQNYKILSKMLEQTRTNIDELEKSKAKFTKIAAHELKTPLTIINGYTSMLRSAIKSEDSEMFELVTGIEAGAERLKSIVQDLIDVSLIDNRMLDLSIQPVWLNRLFETLHLEIASTLKKRNLKFSITSFDGLHDLFFSDPERLLQVFRNIILNAIKFTPDEGQIIIHGRQLPGFIEVIITDTGVGIAQQNQLSIFDKFSQLGEISLHSSSKTKFMGGGPGLGLHISKGIIEAMGGSIWVESKGYDNINYPGSSFHVLIPIDQIKTQENTDTLSL